MTAKRRTLRAALTLGLADWQDTRPGRCAFVSGRVGRRAAAGLEG